MSDFETMMFDEFGPGDFETPHGFASAWILRVADAYEYRQDWTAEEFETSLLAGLKPGWETRVADSFAAIAGVLEQMASMVRGFGDRENRRYDG